MVGPFPNWSGALNVGPGSGAPTGSCDSCSDDAQESSDSCSCGVCHCESSVLPLCGPIDGPPGSDSPSSQGVIVSINAAPYIRDVDIYCVDTGETKRAICGTVTFYHKDSRSKTYTTEGGFCTLCPPSFGTATANPGKGTGTPPTTVDVQCPA